MNEHIGRESGELSPVRHLPATEAGIPLTTRFAVVFPAIESLSFKVEQEVKEREQSNAILDEAENYTPPLVKQFQEGISETIAYLSAQGIRPERNNTDEEKTHSRAPSKQDQQAQEATRRVTREVIRTVHPDVQDHSGREAIPSEWVAGWIEAAKKTSGVT